MAYFRDRRDAGRQLAKLLRPYADLDQTIVLGIPRGGVPIAFEIASALHLPMDIFLSRKLGVPGQEQLAFGAVTLGEGRFIDKPLMIAMRISESEMERITQETRAILKERNILYRGSQPPLRVEGKTVILVDDGIATGANIYAAAVMLRQMHASRLIIAVPVAPLSTSEWLSSISDEFIAITKPEDFYAVGQFYGQFPQVSDEEVVSLLRQVRQPLSSQRAASAS